MLRLRLTAMAAVLSLALFLSAGLRAADGQKTPDSKSDVKQSKTDKPGVSNPGRGGGSSYGDRGGFVSKFISDLSLADFEMLKKLSKDNPEAFKDEIRKRMESRRAESDEQNIKAVALAEKYRKIQDEKEKSKIKVELRSSVKDEFEKKMDVNRKRLEQAEKHLGEFKTKLDERSRNSEEIIDGRVSDLLKDPNVKW